jgi:hypothetical protein
MPTTIRLRPEMVAEPLTLTLSDRLLKRAKNPDLIAICVFVVIGILTTAVAAMAFPLSQDAITLLTQFG